MKKVLKSIWAAIVALLVVAVYSVVVYLILWFLTKETTIYQWHWIVKIIWLFLQFFGSMVCVYIYDMIKNR